MTGMIIAQPRGSSRRAAAAVGVMVIGLVAGAAQAQGLGTDAAAIACPPKLDLRYSEIRRLPLPGKDYDIAGFRPSFTAVGVRLIAADVAPLSDASNELQDGTPDRSAVAGPDELVFTLWRDGQREPNSNAAVTCRYEGGYALQRPLATSTRACTLRYRKIKPQAPETSTRAFYSSAVFTCR